MGLGGAPDGVFIPERSVGGFKSRGPLSCSANFDEYSEDFAPLLQGYEPVPIPSGDGKYYCDILLGLQAKP